MAVPLIAGLLWLIGSDQDRPIAAASLPARWHSDSGPISVGSHSSGHRCTETRPDVQPEVLSSLNRQAVLPVGGEWRAAGVGHVCTCVIMFV